MRYESFSVLVSAQCSRGHVRTLHCQRTLKSMGLSSNWVAAGDYRTTLQRFEQITRQRSKLRGMRMSTGVCSGPEGFAVIANEYGTAVPNNVFGGESEEQSFNEVRAEARSDVIRSCVAIPSSRPCLRDGKIFCTRPTRLGRDGMNNGKWSERQNGDRIADQYQRSAVAGTRAHRHFRRRIGVPSPHSYEIRQEEGLDRVTTGRTPSCLPARRLT